MLIGSDERTLSESEDELSESDDRRLRVLAANEEMLLLNAAVGVKTGCGTSHDVHTHVTSVGAPTAT
jgi:hypothetical protein